MLSSDRPPIDMDSAADDADDDADKEADSDEESSSSSSDEFKVVVINVGWDAFVKTSVDSTDCRASSSSLSSSLLSGPGACTGSPAWTTVVAGGSM